MAKRKDKEEVEEQFDSVSHLVDSIKQKYGNVIFTGDVVASKNPEVISFSPAVDVGLSGGIPLGSIATVSGPAKGGKTTSILNFCKNAQKQGCSIWYFDVEHRLKAMNLDSVYGLDMSNFHVIESSEHDTLSAEKQLNMIVDILQSIKKSVVVVDSFSMMKTEAHMAKDSVNSTCRDDIQKLLSFFFKRIIEIVKINHCVLIGVNHVYANVTGYGPSTVEAGASKLFYARDVAIRLKKREKWEVAGNYIGDMIHYHIDVSALGPPGMEVISHHRFSKGIDETMEIMSMGMDMGLITGSTWLTGNFMEKHVENYNDADYKAQGKEKFYQLLVEHPDWIEYLKQDIKEIIG